MNKKEKTLNEEKTAKYVEQLKHELELTNNHYLYITRASGKNKVYTYTFSKTENGNIRHYMANYLIAQILDRAIDSEDAINWDSYSIYALSHKVYGTDYEITEELL